MNSSDSSCVYCKKTDSVEQYSTYDIFGNDYKVLKCNNCSCFFLYPKPDEKLLAKAYDESYYGDGDEKFKDGYIEKVLNYFRKQRAQIIKDHCKEGRVLDIGCGNGNFLQFVKSMGNFEIHGLEMEGNSAKRAARINGIKLKIGPLQKEDYTINYFDAITMFHVFEHVNNPSEVLDIIGNILKPGGIFVVSFPNIGSWQSKLFKGKWLHMDPPRHLFFFESEPFKKIMIQRGFELVNEKHFNPEYNPFGMSQSLLNVVQKKRDVLYEHLKGNKDYTSDYSKINLIMQDLFYKISMGVFTFTDIIEALFKKGGTVEFVFRKS